ncbi:helix-turn-helix domain-containing protein [Agromyces sp. CFH 90414]|uniref:Helix-turn-helix domain-containing protein n=1 Tax=Agromyces agglutinans TaxID=2662258 RepID=A0A6I2F0G5_9MICO|nr:helix-turn-helix domain-containing protein [Agromyces agglutinans]MRG58905.1 helix-turn-helix domain-containing protein [Agromyces agglutinans]
MSGPGATAPLDPVSAQSRAEQIGVLADPIRLRLMSVLATDPDRAWSPAELGEQLEIDAPSVIEHLERLEAVGLLVPRPGPRSPQLIPSAEAWVRFGRLLAGKPIYAPVEPADERASGAVALPSQIQRIADRLAYRFSAHFSRETVERYVAESYQLLLRRAKTTRHLPSLTSRFASDRLGALAAAQGFDLTGVPEVLFVCVQNSGRSQMAAGLLRSLAGPHVHVRTAGSQPADTIDPLVVQALDEIGVPTVAEFPKPLTDEVVQAADVVVTMGCGDACPVYPGRRYMDWKIRDPLGHPLEEVRRIRDEIRSHVDELMASLGLPADQTSAIR